MRLEVSFSTNRFPLFYRMGIVSFIKECLRKADPTSYEYYFQHHAKSPKPYTFSVYLRDYQLRQDEFELSGFKLFITSSDHRFLIPFLNGLQQTKHFQYKAYQLKREQIRFLPESKVQHSRIIARTLSPILVENRERKPLAPDDPDYNDELNHICHRISLTQRNRPLARPIRLTPIRMKKSVVKEKNETYAQQQQKFLYFTAYHGHFLLEGDPVDLQWLLDNGISLRTGQGFGHILMEREVSEDANQIVSG